MIILGLPTSTLEVLVSGAPVTNQLPWTAHWLDVTSLTQALLALGESDGLTNSSTAVTAVSAPSSGVTRTIKSFTLYNADTTGAQATVRYNNGTSTRVLVSPLLSVGDTLEFSADD